MFGQNWKSAEPVRLPLELHCPCRTGFWFAAILAAFIAVHMSLMVFFVVMMSVKGQFDHRLLLVAPIEIGFAVVCVLMFRSVAARRRIGVGTMILTHSGFWDDRLTKAPIPWTAFNDVAFYTIGKSRRLAGVQLQVDPHASLPSINGDYQTAFQPWTNPRTHILVDLIRFRRRRELAQLVLDLAKEGGYEAAI